MKNVQICHWQLEFLFFPLLPVTEITHFLNALAFLSASVTDNFGMQFGTAASKLGTTPQDHIRNLSSK